MNNQPSNNRLPDEVLGLLNTIFFVPAIALPFAMLLPSVTSPGGVTNLYWGGVAAAVVGIVMLFVARLPFYRQRRFWVFGPRELDRFHRRLYWLAYAVLLVSIGLFGMVGLGGILAPDKLSLNSEVGITPASREARVLPGQEVAAVRIVSGLAAKTGNGKP